MELIIMIAVAYMSYVIGSRDGHDKAEKDFWKAQLDLTVQQAKAKHGEKR